MRWATKIILNYENSFKFIDETLLPDEFCTIKNTRDVPPPNHVIIVD